MLSGFDEAVHAYKMYRSIAFWDQVCFVREQLGSGVFHKNL